MQDILDVENDSLANHFPDIPDPSEPEVLEADNYNARIAKLEEFRILDTQNPRVNKIFFNHQIALTRQVSWISPVRGVMVKWSPGVGKTGGGIAVPESYHARLGQVLKSYDGLFRNWTGRAVIVAHNSAILDENFTGDIYKLTDGAYMTENLRTKTYDYAGGEKRAKSVAIKASYVMQTHTAFSNELAKMTDEEIAVRYSFSIIVFDEIQSLKETNQQLNERGEAIDSGVRDIKAIYTQMMRLVDNIHGSVIIGMSATPIINDVNEFPSTINFVLPKEKRLDPVRFKNITDNPDLEQMEKDLTEYMYPRLLGHISIMKLTTGISKAVVRTNETELDVEGRISEKKLWLSRIKPNTDFNTIDYDDYDTLDYTYLVDTYEYIEQNGGPDGVKQVARRNEVQAATFVFPPAAPLMAAGKYMRRPKELDIGQVGKSIADSFIVTPKTATERYAFNEVFLFEFAYWLSYHRYSLIESLKRKNQNPNIDPDLKAGNEITIAAVEKRIEDTKASGIRNYDYNNLYDLTLMLITIRTRFSPGFADAIRAIIGIEFTNSVGKLDYIVTPDTNNFNETMFDPNDKDNRECAYVFNSNIRPGVIPFGLFMEMFGYENLQVAGSFIRDDKITLTRKKRYVMIFKKDDENSTVSGAMSYANVGHAVALFNHPQNKYGHYLKVVCGTAVTSVGVNFKNVRQAHTLTHEWNDATNLQTEGRVDRPGGSHQAFTDQPPIPTYYDIPYGFLDLGRGMTEKYVKIYRHVTDFINRRNVDPRTGKGVNESIGIRVFESGAFKERKIAIPGKVMDRIGYDSYLNQTDGSRSLIPMAFKGFDEMPVNYINYNLFYARSELTMIKCLIRGYFKTYFQLKLADILNFDSIKQNHNYTTVIKALTEMINDNERIIDRHGMINYLRESNDLFFLQRQIRGLRSNEEAMLSYYSSNLYVRDSENLKLMYDDVQYKLITDIFDNFKFSQQAESEATIRNILNALSNKSKGFIVETLVTDGALLVNRGKLTWNFIQLVFNALKPYVVFANNHQVILHMFDLKEKQSAANGGHATNIKIPANAIDKHGYIFRMYSMKEKQWKNAQPADDEFYREIVNRVTDESRNSVREFDDYGFSSISNDAHIFKIINSTKEAKSSSKVNKNNTLNLKNSTGLQITSVLIPRAFQLVWSIKVSVYALVTVFPLFNGRYPIKMMRLQDDPNGTYRARRIDGSLQTLSPMTIRSKSGTLINMLILSDKTFNFNAVTGQERYFIVHYEHVYPEIMGWIFEDESKRLDTKYVEPGNGLFFPTHKGVYFYPAFTPPDQPFYANPIEIFPADYVNDKAGFGTRLLYGAAVNVTPLEVNGIIITREARTIHFSNPGFIGHSLQLLADVLMRSPPQHPEVNGPANHDPMMVPVQTVNTTFGEVGARFKEAFPLAGDDLWRLIFIFFYLRGSVVQ